MKDGFVSVLCRTLPVVPGDCRKNAGDITAAILDAQKEGVMVLCLQELGLTGATCGDLYCQSRLLNAALEGLDAILTATADTDVLTYVGLPLSVSGKVYNCAAAIRGGRILAVIPQTCAVSPFAPAPTDVTDVTVLGQTFPFGTDILLTLGDAVIACEIGADFSSPVPPSTHHALAGANLICHLAADKAGIGQDGKLFTALVSYSYRLQLAYAHCSAGKTESTTDFVVSDYNAIAECGNMLDGEGGKAFSQVDCGLLSARRCKNEAFFPVSSGYVTLSLPCEEKEVSLTRAYDRFPLVPKDLFNQYAALKTQADGLKKRLTHANVKTLVIGLSGGLDSTLALLVATLAMDELSRPRTDILAVSMPCFGTTDRTKSNAQKLAEILGVRFKEIPIGKAVEQHFADIGLSPDDRSVTYENAQARERTQVLMDISGMEGGMVLGTGDMSEMALGWCTYNGDHMSMYSVNASVTKTLVRKLVQLQIELADSVELQEVLKDILDTPVSPELLPPKEGEIAQKTEDLVGPYELHDFFLYHVLKNGFSPRKIYRLAKEAWGRTYDDETILHWLKTFCRRFFQQAFKRNCVPDGPAVGSISLSPRSGFQMPSDAVANAWLEELEGL